MIKNTVLLTMGMLALGAPAMAQNGGISKEGTALISLPFASKDLLAGYNNNSPWLAGLAETTCLESKYMSLLKKPPNLMPQFAELSAAFLTSASNSDIFILSF